MASIAAYSSLLRSVLAGNGGDVLANAVTEIAVEIQKMQNQLAQFGAVTQNQLGQLSIPSLDITQLSRLYDFYDLPEIQYISTAGTAISPTGTLVRVSNTSGGALTLTSTPTIYSGLQNGQILSVINVGSQPITVQDSGTLSGSNLSISSGQQLLIPAGFEAQFRWSTDVGLWIELGTVPSFIPATQTISVANTTISPTALFVRLNNTSGSDITLTSTPTISAGASNGQVLQLMNVGTKAITLQDRGTLVGSNVSMLTGSAMTIPGGFQAEYQYSTDLGYWVQVGAVPAQAAATNVINYIGPNGTLVLSGVTWSNNTPGAGSIQSSACSATYQGKTYSVASFNTSNSVVFWSKASPTSFSSANFPLGSLSADAFIIAFNSGGIYEPALNLIRSSDGARQILFGDTSFYTNSGGTLMMSTGVGGATSNDHGTLSLYDSTGTARVQALGDTGNIVINQSGVSITMQPKTSASATSGGISPPTTVAGYFQWLQGATTVKVPFYSA